MGVLIEERDEILENLEIAEARYVQSFRLSTPDPSIADFQLPPVPEKDGDRPIISRPKALAGNAVCDRLTDTRKEKAHFYVCRSGEDASDQIQPWDHHRLRLARLSRHRNITSCEDCPV